VLGCIASQHNNNLLGTYTPSALARTRTRVCRRAAFTLGRILASFAAVVASPVTLLLCSLPLAIAGALLALLAGPGAAPAAAAAAAASAAAQPAPAAPALQHSHGAPPPPPSLLLTCVTVLVGLGVAPGFANALALLDSFCPCTGSITGLLGGVAGAGCMTVPLLVACVAKYSAVGYTGLMWVSLGSFSAQLACVPAALLVGRGIRRQALAAAAAASEAGGGGRHSLC
jgi:hypothetical protein